jgi:hypothetical protein
MIKENLDNMRKPYDLSKAKRENNCKPLMNFYLSSVLNINKKSNILKFDFFCFFTYIQYRI